VSSATGTCRRLAQRGSMRQQLRQVRRHPNPRVDERDEIRQPTVLLPRRHARRREDGEATVRWEGDRGQW
jgi:hypothetical protein